MGPEHFSTTHSRHRTHSTPRRKIHSTKPQAQLYHIVQCGQAVFARDRNSWQGGVESVVATIEARVEGSPVPGMITS